MNAIAKFLSLIGKLPVELLALFVQVGEALANNKPDVARRKLEEALRRRALYAAMNARKPK